MRRKRLATDLPNGVPPWAPLRRVIRLSGGRTPEAEAEARDILIAWGRSRNLKMGSLESFVFPTKHGGRRMRINGGRVYLGPVNCTDWYADFS